MRRPSARPAATGAKPSVPPAPQGGFRWAERVRSPDAFALACAVLVIAMAAAPRLRDLPSPNVSDNRRADTIPVHLTAAQFARPPTWGEVIAYYGLEPELVEPTRLANSGADGECPAEPIALPQDVVIALAPGSRGTCRERDAPAQ